MKVSVIIPSYNSARHIEKCLASLENQDYEGKYEVILVDSSVDNTRELAKKFKVKIVHLKEKSLPGKGRNEGVKKAKGEILAFIDSDCIAKRDWLRKGVEANKDVVGGSVKNANPGFISTADHFLTFNEFMGNRKKKVTFMPTCNLFCKKEVFDFANGFREDLAAGEDSLFGLKVREKYQIYYDPSIIVKHNNRTEMNKFVKHHLNFGNHSATLRKKFNLPGKAFAKYPFLALVVPFVRFTRIFLRIINENIDKLPEFVLVSPITFIGLSTWSYGFIRSALK